MKGELLVRWIRAFKSKRGQKGLVQFEEVEGENLVWRGGVKSRKAEGVDCALVQQNSVGGSGFWFGRGG